MEGKTETKQASQRAGEASVGNAQPRGPSPHSLPSTTAPGYLPRAIIASQRIRKSRMSIKLIHS